MVAVNSSVPLLVSESGAEWEAESDNVICIVITDVLVGTSDCESVTTDVLVGTTDMLRLDVSSGVMEYVRGSVKLVVLVGTMLRESVGLMASVTVSVAVRSSVPVLLNGSDMVHD